jgi:hypothetical protein
MFCADDMQMMAKRKDLSRAERLWGKGEKSMS